MWRCDRDQALEEALDPHKLSIPVSTPTSSYEYLALEVDTGRDTHAGSSTGDRPVRITHYDEALASRRALRHTTFRALGLLWNLGLWNHVPNGPRIEREGRESIVQLVS